MDDLNQHLDPNEKLQLQEGNLQLLESKCRALIMKEDYIMAENIVEYFLKSVKSESLAYRLRAEILLKQGKFIQSLKDMEQAIALDPKIESCQSSYEHYQIKKGLMKMSNDI